MDQRTYLSRKDAAEIRRLILCGAQRKVVLRRYNISYDTLRRIMLGTWKPIKRAPLEERLENCLDCGGDLPCLSCARRRRSQNMSKLSREECDDNALRLSEAVRVEAERVRLGLVPGLPKWRCYEYASRRYTSHED